MEVLEVGDKEFWPPRADDGLALVTEWLAAHGVDSVDTYRVELHDDDGPVLRVFRYARDGDGKKFIDRATERLGCGHQGCRCQCPLEVATAPPLDVAMRIPPPVPFRVVGPEG